MKFNYADIKRHSNCNSRENNWESDDVSKVKKHIHINITIIVFVRLQRNTNHLWAINRLRRVVTRKMKKMFYNLKSKYLGFESRRGRFLYLGNQRLRQGKSFRRRNYTRTRKVLGSNLCKAINPITNGQFNGCFSSRHRN